MDVPLNNNPLLVDQSPMKCSDFRYRQYYIFSITPVPDVWPLGLAPRDDEDPGVGHHPD